LAFIVRIRHSGGTPRNSARSGSEHVRPFDQRGDFVEQRVVVDRRQALLRRGACSWRTISPWRAAKLAITAPWWSSCSA
jgi:hypothetical protein